MQKRLRTGGLAAWSINRPVSISVISLAVIVVGLFFLERLNINLLPHIIYPEIRVRIIEPGVPASIMEDRITRQLEEQLAITEGVISTQSKTTEGRSAVSLDFAYGTDIDVALRDASTRLDRAKRFLPTSINPPVIYKRDPSQIAVLEMAVSSSKKTSMEIREWVEYDFSKWFLNLPGVAATETGGGALREIQIIPNQDKLASLGLAFSDISSIFQQQNQDIPSGRTYIDKQEYTTRAIGRFSNIEEIKQLRIPLKDNNDFVILSDIAKVIDTHSDERLRVRLNGQSGIKLSIQKQPEANTVEVVDHVKDRLEYLKQKRIIPDDVNVQFVSDESIFIRHALNNASIAVLAGATLAMLVVFLFLGNIRNTLIIGTAIPLAIFVTFILMGTAGLTLNVMTLGGLALGVGMLVDNTIVMLENITRHQQSDESKQSAIQAASEVTSPIVASTTTNLVAILPFLFIGGLIGLLFSELIYTISAAILASLFVSLTLIPALGYKKSKQKTAPVSLAVNRFIGKISTRYQAYLDKLLSLKYKPIFAVIPFLIASIFYLSSGQDMFLPQLDEGNIRIIVRSDPGTSIETMNQTVTRIENLLLKDKLIKTAFSTIGGHIFGRSTYESSNRSSIEVHLVPASQRNLTVQQWVKNTKKKINKLNLVGFKIRMRPRGIRGINMSRGDDDISIRIRGNDIKKLSELGEKATQLLKDTPGLSNLSHSYEDLKQEMQVVIDHHRIGYFGITSSQIGYSLKTALDGQVISNLIEGDREYDIRMRLTDHEKSSLSKLKHLLVGTKDGVPVRLQDVANINYITTPDRIDRDGQRRMVEISATLSSMHSIQEVMSDAMSRLSELDLPSGYSLYDAGVSKKLKESQLVGYILMGLALFLVFVVLAVQYESVRNPFVIILGVPFAAIGVVIGLIVTSTPISMPVWLGLIMLAGLVVNHAIILIEQIEIERENGLPFVDAIKTASQHRLRPILMTTLTTAFGMLPLALGLGSGAEMLQPLAIVIVFGLLFSMLITLFIIPVIYQSLSARKNS